MSKPWRDTLDEAEAALSIDHISDDINQIRSKARSDAPPRMRSRSSVRSYSSAEARALLEQELTAISAAHAPILEATEPASLHQRLSDFEHREPASLLPSLGEPVLEQRQRRHVSLMAAIDKAIPDLQAMEEDSATNAAMPSPVVKIVPVAEDDPVPHPKTAKRRVWRPFLPVSAAAMIAGLAAYAPANVVKSGASLTNQPLAVIKLPEILVRVPLPVRRPSRLTKF